MPSAGSPRTSSPPTCTGRPPPCSSRRSRASSGCRSIRRPPAATRSRSHARAARGRGLDTVVVYTAGRQTVDDELMRELERMVAAITPHQVLLVADAMTGQDAVATAQGFARRLPVSGVVLTKIEGDARGGAALSLRAVTGKPILFAGTGEKLDALEPFYPERIASRILGMGDVLSLVERAEKVYDRTQAEALQ